MSQIAAKYNFGKFIPILFQIPKMIQSGYSDLYILLLISVIVFNYL